MAELTLDDLELVEDEESPVEGELSLDDLELVEDEPDMAMEATATPEPEETINDRDYTDLGLIEATGQGLVNAASGVTNMLGAAASGIASGAAAFASDPVGTTQAIGSSIASGAQAAYNDPGGTARTVGRMAAPMVGGLVGGTLAGGSSGGLLAATGAAGGSAVASVGFERLLDGLEWITGYDVQDREYKDTSIGGMASQMAGETAEGLAMGGLFGATAKTAGAVVKGAGTVRRGLINRGQQVARRANPRKALGLTLAKHASGEQRAILDEVAEKAYDRVVVRGGFLKKAKDPITGKSPLDEVTKEGDVFKALNKTITYKDPITGKSLLDDVGEELDGVLSQVEKSYSIKDVDSIIDSAREARLPNVSRAEVARLNKALKKPIKTALAKAAGYKDLDEIHDLVTVKPAQLKKLELEIEELQESGLMSQELLAKQDKRTAIKKSLKEFDKKIEEVELPALDLWKAGKEGLNINWKDTKFSKVADSYFAEVRKQLQNDFKSSLSGRDPGLAAAYDKLNGEYHSLVTLKDIAKKSINAELSAMRDPKGPIFSVFNKLKRLAIIDRPEASPAVKTFSSVDKAMLGITDGPGPFDGFYRYMENGGIVNLASKVGTGITKVSDFFTAQNSVLFARGALAAQEWMKMNPEAMQSNAAQILQSPQRMMDAQIKVGTTIDALKGKSEPEQRAALKQLASDSDTRVFLPLDPQGSPLLEGVDTIAGGSPLSDADREQYFINLRRSKMNAFEVSKRRKYFNDTGKFMPEPIKEDMGPKVSDADIEKRAQMLKAREDMLKFRDSRDVAKFSRTSLTQAPDYGVQTLGFDMGLDDNFDRAYDMVLTSEGGFVDDPDDSGGRTNFGVTQDTYNSYLKRQGLGKRDVKNISEDEVREIYQGYWSESGADKLPWPLSATVFDAAINSGSGRAVKQLQKVLGVKQDGRIGPETLEALDSMNAATVMKDFLDERESFYYNLADKRPKDRKYLKGWLNRVKKMRRLAGEDRMDSMGLKIA